MKSFDIDKLSRKMPYAPPSEEFFAKLEAETMQRISNDRMYMQRRIKLAATTITAVAAAVVIALFVVPSERSQQSGEQELNSFISALSDAELEQIIYTAETTEDFYYNF